MGLKSVKLLLAEANKQLPPNNVPEILPGRSNGFFIPDCHELFLLHHHIVLDESAVPTRDYGLWYHLHFGAADPVSMIMTQPYLKEQQRKIERFADRNDIARLNLEQILTGLDFISHLQKEARANRVFCYVPQKF